MFQRQFEFVDGQDKNSRKKTRVHVTREHYRERRWQQVNALKAAKTEPSVTPEPPKPEFVVSVTKLNHDRNVSSKAKDGGAPPSTKRAEHWDQHSRCHGRNGTSTTLVQKPSMNSSPMTFLGAGRIDPFSTYPIDATPEVHRLIDHYHIVVPSLLHRHWGRNIPPSHPMPIIDLFQLYRQDAVSFLGMLHHAAHHVAKTQGRLEETPEIISFKWRTLKILNERLAASSGPYDDGTVIAAGLLANAERVWGDTEVARMHWGALKRMIRDRGGFPGFKHNHLLHTKLVWSFIALSGASPAGNPAYIDTFAESVAVEDGPSDDTHKTAFQRSCDEFVMFFNGRRADALRALPTSQADREYQQQFPMRTTVFRPGTRMYHALSPVETNYSWPEKRRAVDNCRLAALLYLNTVIADYGNFSTKTEAFFTKFSKFVEDDDYDCALSAEHLFWSLIRGIEEVPTHERIWKVSRMIGVIKRANRQTWTDIEDALRLFLVLPEDTSTMITYLTTWDPEAFHEEVMAFSEHYIINSHTLAHEQRRRSSIFDARPEDSDFLPETRDVQWFQERQAAAEAGVTAHPKLEEAMGRLSLSPKSRQSSHCSPDSAIST